MASAFPNLSSLQEKLLFGDKVEIEFSQLSSAELDVLRNLYHKAGPDTDTPFGAYRHAAARLQ